MINLGYQILIMKHFFWTLIFTVAVGHVMAQAPGTPKKDTTIIHICTPSRASMLPPPLCIVFINDKVLYKSNTAMADVAPSDIKSINVLKGNSAIEKYGSAAEHGVVEIYLKKKPKNDIKPSRTDTTHRRVHI